MHEGKAENEHANPFQFNVRKKTPSIIGVITRTILPNLDIH